jgi:hypothetical protein
MNICFACWNWLSPEDQLAIELLSSVGRLYGIAFHSDDYTIADLDQRQCT